MKHGELEPPRVARQSLAQRLLNRRNVFASAHIQFEKQPMARSLQPQSHVVVVDSQTTGYRTLVALAEAQRWNTHFLTSASAAVRFARRLRAELWMIHTSLPEMTGFELYEMLREQFVEATTFMISNQYSADDERRSCRVGADLYLCKDADLSLDCKSLLKPLLPSPVKQIDRKVHQSAIRRRDGWLAEPASDPRFLNFLTNEIKSRSPVMIAVMNENHRYENAFDDYAEAGGIEQFTYRRGGGYPVRSSAARARARKRSRGGAAAKLKARSFDGAHRRVRATLNW